MNQATEGEVIEREFSPDIGALEVLNKSEINVQIATAKRFPRSVTKFQGEAISLVSLDETTAEGCVYALPRDGRTIEGPSARFAEVIAYSWGNCRAGARVVSEEGEFVTAQGVFWDLEKNTAIGYEVKRRIVDKNGRRYKPDMIGVTSNAACSIALRNAILKGVPKALWSPAYEKARQTIMGDFETLANRRAAVISSFQKFGVAPEQIFEKLTVKGLEDITLEHILILRGLMTALRDGDTTVEDAFPRPQAASDRSATARLKGTLDGEAGAAVDAQDETLRTQVEGAAQARPSSAQPPKQRPRGTPKQRKGFLADMEDAKTKLELDAVMAKSGGFEWAKPELDELWDTYNELVKTLPETLAAAQAQQQPEGTLKVRNDIIHKMAACKNMEKLDEAMDEANLYRWTKPDSDTLNAAYVKRREELDK